MNPLTQIKNTQKATRREWALGIGDSASWHARFAHSAYVFAGGLNYELTEGDLLAVFAQYGEVVDVNLVTDRETGRSRGFAFVAYEDQRSTVLAVDNLSGARVAGRTIRVEHVDKYKMKQKEVPQAEAVGGNAEWEGQQRSRPDRSADDVGRWQHDKFHEMEAGNTEAGEPRAGVAVHGNGDVPLGPVFQQMSQHLKETAKKLVQEKQGSKPDSANFKVKRKRDEGTGPGSRHGSSPKRHSGNMGESNRPQHGRARDDIDRPQGLQGQAQGREHHQHARESGRWEIGTADGDGVDPGRGPRWQGNLSGKQANRAADRGAAFRGADRWRGSPGRSGAQAWRNSGGEGGERAGMRGKRNGQGRGEGGRVGPPPVIDREGDRGRWGDGDFGDGRDGGAGRREHAESERRQEGRREGREMDRRRHERREPSPRQERKRGRDGTRARD